MSDNPQIRIVKKGDRPPDRKEDDQRRHEIALLRTLSEKHPDIFREIATDVFRFRLVQEAA